MEQIHIMQPDHERFRDLHNFLFLVIDTNQGTTLARKINQHPKFPRIDTKYKPRLDPPDKVNLHVLVVLVYHYSSMLAATEFVGYHFLS